MGTWRSSARDVRPLTALPHEGAQHLHHGRVIPLGILGDALQGVDATEPYRQLLLAELLDGLGVPLSDLTLLGQLKGLGRDPSGLGGDLENPAVQPKGQQGTYANQPSQ